MIDPFYFSNRQEWRSWLKQNYRKEKVAWIVYYKKESNKPRISYNDAVEEALCFGWIDSNVKSLDNERFVQKFSVRNPKSGYSQANKERLKRLVAEGRVMADILPRLDGVLSEQFEFPRDILQAIKKNKIAWKNFQEYSESYKRIRIAFIEGARSRPLEFQKRLRYFIQKTEKNKQFGFEGIEKYY